MITRAECGTNVQEQSNGLTKSIQENINTVNRKMVIKCEKCLKHKQINRNISLCILCSQASTMDYSKLNTFAFEMEKVLVIVLQKEYGQCLVCV